MFILSSAETVATATIDHSMITTIVAVAAIVSPVITTLISCIFQLANKCVDNKQELLKNTVYHKREILEKYVSCLGEVIHYCSSENEAQYGKYHNLAYLYLPSELHITMSNINTLIKDCDFIQAQQLAEELIPLILCEINKLPETKNN